MTIITSLLEQPEKHGIPSYLCSIESYWEHHYLLDETQQNPNLQNLDFWNRRSRDFAVIYHAPSKALIFVTGKLSCTVVNTSDTTSITISAANMLHRLEPHKHIERVSPLASILTTADNSAMKTLHRDVCPHFIYKPDQSILKNISATQIQSFAESQHHPVSHIELISLALACLDTTRVPALKLHFKEARAKPQYACCYCMAQHPTLYGSLQTLASVHYLIRNKYNKPYENTSHLFSRESERVVSTWLASKAPRYAVYACNPAKTEDVIACIDCAINGMNILYGKNHLLRVSHPGITKDTVVTLVKANKPPCPRATRIDRTVFPVEIQEQMDADGSDYNLIDF